MSLERETGLWSAGWAAQWVATWATVAAWLGLSPLWQALQGLVGGRERWQAEAAWAQAVADQAADHQDAFLRLARAELRNSACRLAELERVGVWDAQASNQRDVALWEARLAAALIACAHQSWASRWEKALSAGRAVDPERAAAQAQALVAALRDGCAGHWLAEIARGGLRLENWWRADGEGSRCGFCWAEGVARTSGLVSESVECAQCAGRAHQDALGGWREAPPNCALVRARIAAYGKAITCERLATWGALTVREVARWLWRRERGERRGPVPQTLRSLPDATGRRVLVLGRRDALETWDVLQAARDAGHDAVLIGHPEEDLSGYWEGADELGEAVERADCVIGAGGWYCAMGAVRGKEAAVYRPRDPGAVPEGAAVLGEWEAVAAWLMGACIERGDL